MVLSFINSAGALLRLKRSTITPCFFNVSSTVEIRKSSGSTPTPQSPVGQHIAGSNIFIFFITINSFYIDDFSAEAIKMLIAALLQDSQESQQHCSFKSSIFMLDRFASANHFLISERSKPSQ